MASKKPAEKKDIATTGGAALPVAVEELEAMSGYGFEDADRDAYAIPFIRLLQTNSPQCNPDEAAYIDGARAGMFFNTVTGQLYGKEINVIPVHYGRDFVEWQPNRGGFVAAHGPDPSILDRVVEIDDKNNSILQNGNIIQDTRNHFVLLADAPEAGPIIVSLNSTGIRHSKKWMSLLGNLILPNSTKKAPMFAGVWKISSIQNENDEGKWYQIGNKSATCVEFIGWVSKPQLEAAKAARELIISGTAKADWESNVDNAPVDSEPSDQGQTGEGPGPF